LVPKLEMDLSTPHEIARKTTSAKSPHGHQQSLPAHVSHAAWFKAHLFSSVPILVGDWS